MSTLGTNNGLALCHGEEGGGGVRNWGGALAVWLEYYFDSRSVLNA